MAGLLTYPPFGDLPILTFQTVVIRLPKGIAPKGQELQQRELFRIHT